MRLTKSAMTIVWSDALNRGVSMNNTQRRPTVDPISYATPLATSAEFMRLPRARERDPIFGLSRGYLNTLILPMPENNYRPPVVSCVLRQRGARTGVRLINVESLRKYVLKHLEPNSGEETSPEAGRDNGAGI
jgi:hypothetical protein